MTPDVNVLVAASQADHPHHPVAHAWLLDALKAGGLGGRLALLPMVTAGFLRIATHPRVFSVPTPTSEAIRFVETLLRQPGVSVLELGPEWSFLAEICATHSVAGGDLSDVWIAAAVLAHGDHLVTFDREFRHYLPTGRVTVLRPPGT